MSTRTREIIGRVLIALVAVALMAGFVVIVGRNRTSGTGVRDLSSLTVPESRIPDPGYFSGRDAWGDGLPEDYAYADSLMPAGDSLYAAGETVSPDSFSEARGGAYGRFVESVLSEEEAWRGWLHFLMYAFPLLLLVWIIVKLIGRPAGPKTVYETRTIVEKCELPSDVLRRGDVSVRCLKVSEEELAERYNCIYRGWMGEFFWEWLYNRIKKAEDIPSGAVRFVMDAFKCGNILTLKDYDSYVDYVNRTEFFEYHDIDSFRDFVFRKEDEERKEKVWDSLFDEKKECAASGGDDTEYPRDLPESLGRFSSQEAVAESCGTAEPEEEDEPRVLGYREMPVSEVNDLEKECPDPDLPKGVDIDGLRSEELDSKVDDIMKG